MPDVLGMTVDEAAGFLPTSRRRCEASRQCRKSGSGTYDSASPRPSCPAAKRNASSSRRNYSAGRRGHALYLLDEPTTGLHPSDVELLLHQLHRLVDAGNTVVVVEQHLDVIAAADWIIDLRPGAGDKGGTIVATGPPEEVARSERSRTAPYLAEPLQTSSARRGARWNPRITGVF